jgi:hypothetical protein
MGADELDVDGLETVGNGNDESVQALYRSPTAGCLRGFTDAGEFLHYVWNKVAAEDASA